MSIQKLSAAICAAFLVSNAFAHSGADEFVQIGSIETGNGTIPIVRETAYARFDIAPADVGRPGQLVLIYQSTNGPMAVLTRDGWKGFVNGLAEPLLATPSLDPTYSVVFFDVVFQGAVASQNSVQRRFVGQADARMQATPFSSPDYSHFPGTVLNARMPQYETSTLCGALEQRGYGHGTIYAAYGALQPEAEQRIKQFHAVNNPKLSADHLRNVYIELDGREGQKYSEVIDLSCAGGVDAEAGS